MPPFLRHGKVVGRHKRPKGSKFYLCDCWDCYNFTSMTGERGRYLGPSEFREHQARQRGLGVGTVWQASLCVDTLDPATPLPTSVWGVPLRSTDDDDDQLDTEDDYTQELDDDEMVQGGEQSTRRQRRATVRQSSQLAEIDGYYTKLKSIHVRLKAFSVDQLSLSGIVFSSPPTATSLPLPNAMDSAMHLIDLDPEAQVNSPLLKFEQWLSSANAFVSGHCLRYKTTKLRLMTSVVVASIDEARNAVTTFKRQEYEKGRIAVVNNCGPNVLDTSTYFFLLHGADGGLNAC